MSYRLESGTNVPNAFAEVRFADYDRKRGDPNIIQALKSWAPTVECPSLLLVGPPGLGKTLLASAVLNKAHAKYPMKSAPPASRTWFRQQKFPVYFIQLAEFIDLHHRLFRMQSAVERGEIDSEDYWLIDRLIEDLKCKVKMLVIDDVGKEHRTSSGFAEDAFDLLVRLRHNRGLTTIFTSNIPLNEWADQYSESMRSLIQRSSLVLDFSKSLSNDLPSNR